MSRLKFIQQLLESGGEVYIVGGNVRDHFLEIPHKDYDLLVRNIAYPFLTNILKSTGMLNQVGKSFGVLKFRPDENPEIEFDLSLPRVEKSTGTGHRDFTVDFNPGLSVEKDLSRRDFTINAMAINLSDGKLVDPFGGKRDLENKIVRQVFKEAFVEDPLRLLRAVQFSARFSFMVENETLNAMKTHANLIKTVSRERIAMELKKLFSAPRPSVGFELMREVGMLESIFPFLNKMIGVLQPMKKNEDVFMHTMKVIEAARLTPEMEKAGDLNLMFASLLHDAGKPATASFDEAKKTVTFYGHQIVSKRIAGKWLNEYKVSCIGVDTDKVLKLIENHMFETKAYFSDRAIRRFINKIGVDNIFDLIDLRIADKKGGRYPESMKGILNLRKRIRDEISKKPPFTAKDLAVNGFDIMNMGFKAGPIIGKIQKFLVEKVLDDPDLNTKEELSGLITKNFPPEDEKNKNPHPKNKLPEGKKKMGEAAGR